MKKFLFFLGVMTVAVTSFAQGDETYQPIEKVGWEVSDFSPPDNLTDDDVGKVNYLLTLNTKGKLKSIKILSNTFTKKTELLWRKKVKKMTFTPDPSRKSIINKGTFFIERQRCSDENTSRDLTCSFN